MGHLDVLAVVAKRTFAVDNRFIDLAKRYEIFLTHVLVEKLLVGTQIHVGLSAVLAQERIPMLDRINET